MADKPKVLRGPRPGSRKAILEALEVGESVIFHGDAGGSCNALQSSISSTYRGSVETLQNQGFTQAGGMLIFEGELPTPVSRVTRISKPTV